MLFQSIEPLYGDVRRGEEEMGSRNKQQTGVSIQKRRRIRVPPFREATLGWKRGLGLQKWRRLIWSGRCFR